MIASVAKMAGPIASLALITTGATALTNRAPTPANPVGHGGAGYSKTYNAEGVAPWGVDGLVPGGRPTGGQIRPTSSAPASAVTDVTSGPGGGPAGSQVPGSVAPSGSATGGSGGGGTADGSGTGGGGTGGGSTGGGGTDG
ncbi:MAG TPA: hypothetical protein VEJ21_07040, partial [Acidimicrobiales bacterium]|nr:hypothetical protein [Acidimicrobiales bacterium]